ncbi:hypothetical protein EDC01DRAFT_656589 [Geopyxis carbonaria]|nr:hypothetical protein EDC01DRAFT_656589 [Geopyxis carbonaria]
MRAPGPRLDRRWRPLPLLPLSVLLRALATLPTLLLASILLTRPHNLPNIAILDPLSLLISLTSLAALLLYVSLFRRSALTPCLVLASDATLTLVWAAVLAGRTFIWAYTLDKKLCYSTPWLARDALLRQGCAEVKAGFATAVVGFVVWACATGVSAVVVRKGRRRGRRGAWKEASASAAANRALMRSADKMHMHNDEDDEDSSGDSDGFGEFESGKTRGRI